jgi:hypothetical protein
MIAILHIDFATFVTTGKMVFIWSLVEWAVALIVASAPLLRPVVKSILRGENLFRDSHSARSDKGYPLSSVTNASVARNNAFHGGSLEHEGGLLDEGNERSRDEIFTRPDEAATGSTYANEFPYDGHGNASSSNGSQTWAIEQNRRHNPNARPVDRKRIRIFTEVTVER